MSKLFKDRVFRLMYNSAHYRFASICQFTPLQHMPSIPPTSRQ